MSKSAAETLSLAQRLARNGSWQPVGLPSRREWTDVEVRVLNGVRTCCEQWGVEKTTIDDIAKMSGVSRATLYRLFPGGRDVLFEAHRVRELDDFFQRLLSQLGDAKGLHRLLARAVSIGMRELTSDAHLTVMLAAEPGQIIGNLSVEGLPRTTRVATAYLLALVDPYLPRAEARRVIDVTVRLVISYFLAPDPEVDLCDEQVVYDFLVPFLPIEQQSDQPVEYIQEIPRS